MSIYTFSYLILLYRFTVIEIFELYKIVNINKKYVDEIN